MSRSACCLIWLFLSGWGLWCESACAQEESTGQEAPEEASKLATAREKRDAAIAWLGRGQAGEAERGLREAVRLLEEAGNPVEAADVFEHIARSRVAQSDGQGALAARVERVDRLLPLSTDDATRSLAWARFLLGLNHLQLGQLEPAAALLREASAGFEASWGAESKEALTGVNALANVLWHQGHWEEAAQLLERLYRGRDILWGKQWIRHLEVMGNLANTYRKLGRWTEAAEMFDQAHALGREHPELSSPESLAGLRINHGRCLRSLGRFESAMRSFERALEDLEYMAEGRERDVLRSHLWNDIGECARYQDRFEVALEAHERALSLRLALEPRDLLLIGHSENNLADTLGALDRNEDGRRHFELALESYEKAGLKRSPRFALTQSNLATLLMKSGRLQEAKILFDEAAPVLSTIGPSNIRVTLPWRCSHAWTLIRLGHLDQARVILEEACAELARVRATGEGLDAVERARLTQQARHLDPHHLLASVEARSKNGATAFRAIESGRSRELLALFDATRRPESTAPGALALAEPLSEVASLEEVQAALGPREKILIYSVGNTDSVAILIGREQLVHWLPSAKGGRIPEHRWTSLIEGYLDFIRLPPDQIAPRGEGEPVTGGSSADTPGQRGLELFRALMPDEIWAQLRDVDVLYVCPHGPLTSLPFEALIVAPESDWPEAVYWLDVGPKIAYLPSASFLPRMVSGEPVKGEPRRVVVLGDPFSAEASLPGARLEIERIEKVVSRDERAVVVSLTGANATRARLFEAAEGAEILHLATHGRVARRGDTIEASLLLAAEPDSELAGALTLTDLLGDWRGRLRQSRLTVLSACETARGERLRDEGQLALPLGFQVAGCPRVVASYWPVADTLATPELMEYFYEGLMDERSTVLSDLVEAKQRLRKVRPHLFYWASFALYGVH